MTSQHDDRQALPPSQRKGHGRAVPPSGRTSGFRARKQRLRLTIGVAGLILGIVGICLAVIFYYWPPHVSVDQSEVKLDVYSCLNLAVNEALEEAFQLKEGVNIEIHTNEGPAKQLADRLAARSEHPRADVFLGGPVDVHNWMQDVYDNLAPIHVPGEEGLPSHIRNSRWKAWYSGVLAIMYRPEGPLSGIDVQTLGWEVLLASDELRIALPDPAAVGGGRIFIATQFERLGDEALDWLSKVKQRAQLVPSIVGPIVCMGQPAETRQVDVGVSWFHDIKRLCDTKGYDFRVFIPSQTGMEYGAVSVLKDTRRLEVARKFIQFLLSTESAQINYDAGGRLHANRDAAPNYRALDIEQLLHANAFPKNWGEWLSLMEHRMEKWEELSGGETSPCAE